MLSELANSFLEDRNCFVVKPNARMILVSAVTCSAWKRRGAPGSIWLKTWRASSSSDSVGMGLDQKCWDLEWQSSHVSCPGIVGLRSNHRRRLLAPVGHPPTVDQLKKLPPQLSESSIVKSIGEAGTITFTDLYIQSLHQWVFNFQMLLFHWI